MSYLNKFPGSEKFFNEHAMIKENKEEEVVTEYKQLLPEAIAIGRRTLALEPLLELQESFATYDDYIEALVETPEMSRILLKLLEEHENLGVTRENLDDPHWQYDQLNPYRANNLNDLLQVADVSFKVAEARETVDKLILSKFEQVRKALKIQIAEKKRNSEPVTFDEAKASFLLGRIAILLADEHVDLEKIDELTSELDEIFLLGNTNLQNVDETVSN